MRSRLESFIDRVIAQRDLLDLACRDVAALPGPFVELGLGNGRTFDHLRARAPDRRIIAFDRKLAAHPRSVPPADDLVLGEIATTAADHARRQGPVAALVHADIGTSDPAIDAETRRWLPEVAAALARPGAVVLSGLDLSHRMLLPEPTPSSIAPGRYFRYRRA